MKKKIIIAASVVVVALIGLAVAAGGPHWYGAKSTQARLDYIKVRITETLELTETQAATLDRIAGNIFAEHDQMEIRREDFKARFFEVLNQDQLAAEDLTVLFNEKKPHIERLMQLAAQHIAEFHAILTPDQRARLITELKNHRRGCRFGR